MNTLDYTLDEVKQIGVNAFRDLVNAHPSHCIVGNGPIKIRVSANGTSVLVQYRTRENVKAEFWSEVKEHTIAI